MLLTFRKLPIEARSGLAILVLILAMSVAIPALSHYDPLTGTSEPLLSVSAAHPFGTDQLGRDVFVRAFAAARLDILLALSGVSIPLVIGTFLGAVVGTVRSPLIAFVWTIVGDAINAFPLIVLVIVVVAG